MSGEQGIDFSHYQGTIDWPAVRSDGISYAYGKVTEGDFNIDPLWSTNRNNALAAGIKLGGYHWVHPNVNVASAARLFMQNLGWVGGMLPIILDVEHNGSPSGPTGPGGCTPTQIHTWIHEFIAAVGKPCGIYTGDWFWSAYVEPAAADCGECAARPLWLSRYAPQIGRISRPWKNADFWQYTDSGSVHGVAGLVDRDVFVSSSLSELLAYSNPSSKPTVPTQGEDLPVDQATFNKLMDAYFDARIPAADKPAANSISERLAGRTASYVRANGVADLQNHAASELARVAALQADVDAIKAQIAKLVQA